MEDEHFGLKWKDADASAAKWLADNADKDELKNLLNKFAGATDGAELRKLLFEDTCATGMGAAKDMARTVREKLNKITEELRTHRCLSADISFDLRRCLPKPFLHAVRALSEGNGLHEEAVAWCFYANIAFLEHHTRRIGQKPGEHTQAPNLPLFIGGPPSSRKTCLLEMTNQFLLQVPEAPKMMQNRECLVADATVAGIRTAIYNYNRAAVVSDEASNVYETPWSDKGSGGLHFLLKAKMNNYVLSEADDQATGRGQVHLGSENHPYLFLHKVAGQTEIIEYIAQPVTNGFHKRFNLVFQIAPAIDRPQTHTASAKEFFSKMHGWLYKNAWEKEGKHFLDGFALNGYLSVKQAVEEFCAETNLDKDAIPKVRFWASDVLRLAHANMRICQICVALYGSDQLAAAEASRCQPNVYEFILAVNMWLRQLHVHLTFYKWFRKMQDNRSGKELGAAMERSTDDDEYSKFKESLPVGDRLKHEILVHKETTVGSKIASDQVRLWVRNMKFYKANRLSADSIKTALDELYQVGLLDLFEEEESTPADSQTPSPPVSGSDPKRRARKGKRPNAVYVKKSAKEIEKNKEANDARQRLVVPIKHFWAILPFGFPWPSLAWPSVTARAVDV